MIDLKILKELNRKIRSRTFLKPIGKEARDIIYKRTKSGGGVSQDSRIPAGKTQLKELSEKYIKARQKVDLGRFGKPGRSNLTLTGQMLDALSFKASSGVITLFVKNTNRRPTRFRKSKRKPQKSKVSNAKVAEFVSDQGRPFLNFTKQEVRILTFMWKRKVEAELNKIVRRI